jgi:DnaJ-class molecular chaperone
VLSDPEKRKRYDQLGADWDKVGAAPGGASGFPGGFHVRTEGFGGGAAGFSDFFRTFFGGGGTDAAGFEDAFARARSRRPAEPEDMEQEVDLTYEEAVTGTRRSFQIDTGSSNERVEVRIPAGLHEGARIRMAGKGANGGDIYLRVRFAAHAGFERRGDDLATRVKAPLTTVVLGGEVEVPTLEGVIGIKVPAGTPSERSFRLRGKGLPRQKKGERGDLLVSVEPMIPSDLSHREKELFEELQRIGR